MSSSSGPDQRAWFWHSDWYTWTCASGLSTRQPNPERHHGRSRFRRARLNFTVKSASEAVVKRSRAALAVNLWVTGKKAYARRFRIDGHRDKSVSISGHFSAG